jgi:predicted ATPase/DNA-binding SARP family transcriptional activator
MRFEVLGPLRVTDGDRTLPLGEPQQQKLLALLLASPNQTVGVDRLIDEMWPVDPPASAHHLVEVYVSRLRRLLADSDGLPRLVRDGRGYRIQVEPDELDADRLGTVLDQARGVVDRDPVTADRLLASFCPDGGERPLGDLADDSPGLRTLAVHLEELILQAVEARVEARLRLGRHHQLAGELERLTAEHPYRERLWELRMLALYRAGRQAEALETAGQLRALLGGELGIDPSPAVLDMEERILLHDPGLLWEPPLPPSNLPHQLTSFVGRSWEIAEVAKLIDTHRLVTLTGPGGAGKTRLAIEVAERVLSRFADGVWWVDLAPARTRDQVTAALAGALGLVRAPAEATGSIVRSLAPRTALLVIDSCEHLTRPVAALVTAVLQGSRHVRVLATSRTRLGSGGEVTWSVPGLSLPEPDALRADLLLSDAVRLLVERAGAVDRTFTLTDANTEAVVEICRRLDALPLAIEMAAARLRTLSPAQIAAGLEERFELLADTSSSRDRRHGTLEATCAWSHHLLDPPTRRVFDRLAVLAGAFDLDAAAAVGCPEPGGPTADRAVAHLVEASMLTVDRHDDRVRYRMLETLRQFGSRNLVHRGELEPTRDAHARHFLGLAVTAGEHIVTPGFAAWSEGLVEVDDDLHQALEWSLSHHPRAETLRAAPGLFYHWYRVGQARQAAQWSARMLEGAADAPPELQAWAHMAGTFAANVLGDPEAAELHSGEALRLLEGTGTVTARVMALFARAQWAFQIGTYREMAQLCRRALQICDDEGRTWDRAGPLSLLGIAVLFESWDLDQARRLVEDALPLHRRLGHIGGLTTINPLSPILRRKGDLEGAERAALQACAWAAGSGWEAQPLVFLAEVLVDRADLDAARGTLRRALRRSVESGLEVWYRTALRVLALVEARSGHPELSARLVGASGRNLPFYAQDPAVDAEIEATVRAALDGDTVARLEAEGFDMSDQEVLELVEAPPFPSAGDDRGEKTPRRATGHVPAPG